MLDRILTYKRLELATIDFRSRIPEIRRRIATAPPVDSLLRSLTHEDGMAIIAEIKRRSPSRGRLADGLSVTGLARDYEHAGARGISVLTEARFFQGSIEDLKAAKEISQLPILRKDFILEEFQVWESRDIGADAILLIAAILPWEKLSNLHALARRIGLEVLIEVHNAVEVEKALAVKPKMIGINNRDLTTFTVDLKTTEKLRPLIPAGIVCVSESGINKPEDIERLATCNIDAALIGEALVTSPDPRTKIRELLGKNDNQD